MSGASSEQSQIALTWCAICERDRCDAGCPSGWPGEERGDTWICLDCLATEPCVECNGEHHHALPCDPAADPRRYTTDSDGPEVDCSWGDLVAANAEDVGALLEIRALDVGESTVLGMCTWTRRIA